MRTSIQSHTASHHVLAYTVNYAADALFMTAAWSRFYSILSICSGVSHQALFTPKQSKTK